MGSFRCRRPGAARLSLILLFAAFSHTPAIGQDDTQDPAQLRAELETAKGLDRLPILAQLLQAHRKTPLEDAAEIAAAADALQSLHPDAALRADVLNNLAWYFSRSNDTTRGLARAEEAQSLATTHGDRALAASSDYMVSVSHYFLSNHEAAIDAGNKALAGFTAANNLREQGNVHTLLGAAYRRSSDYTNAIDQHWKALAIAEEISDPAGVARAKNNLGLIHWSLDQHEIASAYISDAVDHYREAGPSGTLITALSNLGLIYTELRKPEQAIAYLESALALDPSQLRERQRGMLLSNLSYAHESLGDLAAAHDYLDQAIAVRRSTGDQLGLARNLGSKAALYRYSGDLELAAATGVEAVAVAEAAGARSEQASIQSALAQTYKELGRDAEALTALRAFIALSEDIDSGAAESRIRELEAAQAVAAAEIELLQHKQKQRLLWFFGAILALVCFALWAYARSRSVLLGRVRRSHIQLEHTTQALAESEKRYRSLFDDTNEPRLLIDLEANEVLDYNAAAAQLCGAEPDTLVGATLEDIRPAWLSSALARADETREAPLGVHESWFNKDGEEYFADVWIAPVPLAGRRCALVAVHDTTADRRDEENRIRAGKLESLGVLAGGIAHDFNNALSVVLGYVTMARTEIGDKADMAQLLGAAERSIDHAAKLSNHLLTFAKGGAPRRERQDIGLRLTEAARLATSGSSLQLKLQIDDDLWNAHVDVGQFSQLISNLIRNAISASPKGGVLEVSAMNFSSSEALSPTVDSGDYVRIDIADSGHGIPLEIQNKVMDPYFTTTPGNSGLGLASAFAIASRHDGWLSFLSKPGQGTTFSVYLPAHVVDLVMPAQPVAAPVTGRKRILVMDDDREIRAMYVAAVRRLGYDIVVTERGEAAIEAYRESLASGEPFDLVIMDLTVPGGMGGKDTISAILALNPDVRAIVASGYSNDPVMSAFEASGFKAALHKPFSLEELDEALRGVLNDALDQGDHANGPSV